MSARGQFWVTTVLSAVIGAAGWWALFIEHPQTLGWLVAAATLAMFPLGVLAGWKLCSWRSGGRADELGRLRERVSEDAERIASLKVENRVLKTRLDAAVSTSGMSEADFERRVDAWMRDHEATNDEIDAMFE